MIAKTFRPLFLIFSIGVCISLPVAGGAARPTKPPANSGSPLPNPNSAFLTILAGKPEVQGSKISIDGKEIPQTIPADRNGLRLPLTAGTHEIRASQPGGLSFYVSLPLKQGEERKIYVFLSKSFENPGSTPPSKPVPATPVAAPAEKGTEPAKPTEEVKLFKDKVPPGILHLVTVPKDVEVFIDGVKQAEGKELFELPPGEHELEVSIAASDREAKSAIVLDNPTPSTPSTSATSQAIRTKISVESEKSKTLYLSLKNKQPTSFGIIRARTGNVQPGTSFVINGRSYTEAQIFSDQGLRFPTGEVHFSASKEGAGTFSKTFQLRSSKEEEFIIKLENKGAISISSQPSDGKIFIDKIEMNKTPNTYMVDVGTHTVEVKYPGYVSFRKPVSVELDKTSQVVAILEETRPDTGEKEKEVGPEEAERRKLEEASESANSSSFGAVTISPGHFTVDIGAGWPYIARTRLNVGAFKPKTAGPLKDIGLDVGVEFRSAGYSENSLGANLRLQFGKPKDLPLYFGTNLYVGGGGGPRGRNSAVVEWGFPITLVAKKRAWITLRPYFQFYSDRNCQDEGYIKSLVNKPDKSSPDWAAIQELGNPEHAGDRCVGYGTSPIPGSDPLPSNNPVYAIAGISGFNSMGTPIMSPGGAYYRNASGQVRPEFKVGNTPVLERFTGIRAFLQFAFEVNLVKSVGIYGYLEMAPGQGERQSLTDKFNRIAPITDATNNELGPVYGGLGLTIRN